MGTLNAYPFFSRYQSAASDFVTCIRAGTLIRSGADRAFWFRSVGTALAQVPLIEREQTVLVKAISSDQQNVNVQVSLTHRIADPLAAAQRFDFDLFPRSSLTEALGAWQTSELAARIARSVTIARIATTTLEEALDSGINAVTEALNAATAREERLASTGVKVCDVCVLSVRPDEAAKSALCIPLLEQLQSKADRAPYERRAFVVEQERQISKTELASKFELERRCADLVAQEDQNVRYQAEEKVAADFVEANASAERRNILFTAQAEEITQIGVAKNEVKKARLDAFAALDADVLETLALHDLAGNLPAVGQINITPDMLQGVLTDLVEDGK